MFFQLSITALQLHYIKRPRYLFLDRKNGLLPPLSFRKGLQDYVQGEWSGNDFSLYTIIVKYLSIIYRINNIFLSKLKLQNMNNKNNWYNMIRIQHSVVTPIGRIRSLKISRLQLKMDRINRYIITVWSTKRKIRISVADTHS